ncbi:hypothetical protein Tco_0835005 [Tanacetum coccineum]
MITCSSPPTDLPIVAHTVPRKKLDSELSEEENKLDGMAVLKLKSFLVKVGLILQRKEDLFDESIAFVPLKRYSIHEYFVQCRHKASFSSLMWHITPPPFDHPAWHDLYNTGFIAFMRMHMTQMDDGPMMQSLFTGQLDLPLIELGDAQEESFRTPMLRLKLMTNTICIISTPSFDTKQNVPTETGTSLVIQRNKRNAELVQWKRFAYKESSFSAPIRIASGAKILDMHAIREHTKVLDLKLRFRKT